MLPDASGRFTATFPAGTFNPGDQGHLRYIDADGNRVYVRFKASKETVISVRGRAFGYVMDNLVSGGLAGCENERVRVVLKDRNGQTKAEKVLQCNSWGDIWAPFEDAAGNPVAIEGGDVVEVEYGGKRTSVSVPTFTVVADPNTQTVTGTTNATVVTTTYGLTQTLTVWPNTVYDSSSTRQSVLPDASGRFTATFPAGTFNPGHQGHLRYIGADGHRIYVGFAALRDKPEVWVKKDDNLVWGYVPAAAVPVTVTLKRSGAVVGQASVIADTDGRFAVTFYNASGEPIVIQAGDEVVIEASPAFTVPVVPLSARADVENDLISGTGPANALLNVIVNGRAQSVRTDGSGNFTVSFVGIQDVQIGQQVEVQYRNDEGHYVYTRFVIGPKVYALLYTDYVWGVAPSANAPLTVTLKAGDGTVKGSDTATSNGSNLFWSYLRDTGGKRVHVQSGDVVEVDFGGGHVVSMTVASLAANVDADNDVITGTAPADSRIGVEIASWRKTVETDSSGNWNVAPGAEGQPLDRGDQVLVRYQNENGHETWLYAVAPVVYVRGNGPNGLDYRAENFVSGYATRQAIVNVTLKRGGTVVASESAYAENDGYYAVYLQDALGFDAPVQGGDQVVVAASAPLTVTVPDMQATVDAQNDMITGRGPANAEVGIYVNGNDRSVRTDASGAFTLTLTNVLIDPGDTVYVRYRTPEKHWVHARFQAEYQPVINARWDGSNAAACGQCVSGNAGVGGTTVNLLLKRGGTIIARASDRSDSAGNFKAVFKNTVGEPVEIEAGDVIEMNVGGHSPVTMTVASLTAQANGKTGILYGSGPANARLNYKWQYPWGTSGTGDLTVGPDGRYAENLGVGTGATGYVYYTDQQGHRTYVGWAAAHVWVREKGSEVGGYVEPGVPVTVRVLDGSGREKVRAQTTSSSFNGLFTLTDLRDATGNVVIIEPNDTVVVSATSLITVPVVPLSAQADKTTDKVTGTGGEPGSRPDRVSVQLHSGGDWYWRNVTVASDGTFTADFSNEADIQAGDEVYVHYTNEDGNRVYIRSVVPIVRVNSANDIVDGYVTPNATVRLTLKRSGNVLATATTTSDGEGFFSAFFVDATGKVVDIRAGDVVEVTASPTFSITVAAISATVNPDDDTVSGTGPANTVLLVKAVSESGEATKPAYTDGEGNFRVDFSDSLDITGESYVFIVYRDASGNKSAFHVKAGRLALENYLEQTVLNAGGQVEKVVSGVANDGDLTPPVTYQGGGGTLVFAARNGRLVITKPDGSILKASDYIEVKNAPVGEWKVQVRVSSTGVEGVEYGFAIGKIGYQIYLPVVKR